MGGVIVVIYNGDGYSVRTHVEKTLREVREPRVRLKECDLELRETPS